MSFGQCFPRFNIKIYLFGLVEQTYQVSSQRSIDRCLSSDRCVCGGKQSSGIIDKRYASAECTCNKARKVAYNTASDSNYTAVTAIALSSIESSTNSFIALVFDFSPSGITNISAL